MRKTMRAALAMVLVVMLLVGQTALADAKRGENAKVEDLAGAAKRKFKGTVKASIKTKGKLEYGQKVTLKATVQDAKKADYALQWQVREDGEWKDIPGETQKTYTFTITEQNANQEWRVAMIAEAFEA